LASRDREGHETHPRLRLGTQRGPSLIDRVADGWPGARLRGHDESPGRLRRGLVFSLLLALLAAPPAHAQNRGLPQEGDPWWRLARQALQARLATPRIDAKARNVILFVADGMGPTTVTAARIFQGQRAGGNGEEHVLHFERFPHLALAKTYTVDAQTAGSAATMSALVTGVKTRFGVLSVGQDVAYGDCEAALARPMTTIAELAEMAGMSTGVVSTARLTHATPAAVYAHSPARDWEDDTLLPPDSRCRDIARQLVEFAQGDGIDVALGGGRANFLPQAVADPEYPDLAGRRADGRDLTRAWTRRSPRHVFVWNERDFDAVDPAADPKLLGLFEHTHMRFDPDRGLDRAGEPSLESMTRKAIAILSRNPKGYFLHVEAGRVDHAHHANNAARALHEVAALDEAVRAAVELTRAEDTLIIVTADHGHTLGMNGYASRGNPILGLAHGLGPGGAPSPAPLRAADGKPYTVLGYLNGPGSILVRRDPADGGRADLSRSRVEHLDHVQQALVPLRSETHGGQDVPVYARGPRAFLLDGTVEQHYIFHAMEHALELRRRAGLE
jgi:alkaline phosphatase